jgi:hypothetical protein
MNSLSRRGLWWRLVLALSAACGLCVTANAQTPPATPTGVITKSLSTNLPPLPVFGPVTELFRKVLAMTETGREAWLTNRPSQARSGLEAKIKEYLAMKPEAREAVLYATELHEYLEYFIKAPAADRGSELAQIPLEYRATVREKVAEFGLLPPELQKEVLAGKTTAEYFLSPASPPRIRHPLRPPVPMPPLPPPREPLKYLSRLSPGERQSIYASFEHFFDLNNDDQQKILAMLPPNQRGPVEKTLRDLDGLPKEQRDRGLQSVGILAGMTDEQRGTFFRNAELWEKLPSAERQTWRKVVAHLPPPPPMPPQPHEGLSFATNPSN